MSGPLFHWSDTWQLVINTGTTIVTFLMVFLIQSTQNRDADSRAGRSSTSCCASRAGAHNVLIESRRARRERARAHSRGVREARARRRGAASMMDRSDDGVPEHRRAGRERARGEPRTARSAFERRHLSRRAARPRHARAPRACRRSPRCRLPGIPCRRTARGRGCPGGGCR